MKRYTWITAAILSGLGLAAFAHSGATGVVKERMDGMSAMGKAIKDITPIMRGKVAYDSDEVRAFTEAVRLHSGEAMTRLFPEGSGGMPSEANATIWTDWEGFQELADQLELLAEGLAEAADNGLGAGSDAGGMADNSAMMGGQSMMGGQTMMGSGSMENVMGVEELAEMSADSVFMMISQTCSACHTKYRSEAN